MRKKLNYMVYLNTFLLSLLWICLLDSIYSKEIENESQQLLALELFEEFQQAR